MRALSDALSRIASSSAPLLICGEPGAGKGLVARAVHARSDRVGGPCIAVACSANQGSRPEVSLLDALQAAEGGTVILNGIDGLSIDLQARLLRALRRREIDGIDTGQGRLHARIISTVASDLGSAVEQGRFRESLYRQLNGMSIEVPPLRTRGRDVQLLADYFMDKFTTPGSRRRVVGFSPDARLAMQEWAWPGNVRELQNRIRQAIVTCERGPLGSSDLGLDVQRQAHIPLTLAEARGSAGS
jgi:DNA-binding NtrC family response regulator